jgi:PPOX class probable F420-dependent enzyme
MELEEARRFVSQNHHAVMVTLGRDGRPQTSVVACGVDEAGRVVVSTRETAFKTRNLRRDPRVSLCVVRADFGGWIQVDGRAEVVSLPQAMESLVDYYRRVAGEHPDWDDYRAAMERDRRVLVRIDVERAGPDRHG